MTPIPIDEARAAVAEATRRLEKIASTRASLAIRAAAHGSVVAAAEARWAAAALGEADIEAVRCEQSSASIESVMSPAEARRAMLALDHTESEAKAALHDARSVLRRAVVAELKAATTSQLEAFDKQATELQAQWLRCSVLLEKLGTMVGMPQNGLSWTQLRIPRGVVPKSTNPFFDGSMHPPTGELMSSGKYHAARAEVAALLKDCGVLAEDVT